MYSNPLVNMAFIQQRSLKTSEWWMSFPVNWMAKIRLSGQRNTLLNSTEKKKKNRKKYPQPIPQRREYPEMIIAHSMAVISFSILWSMNWAFIPYAETSGNDIILITTSMIFCASWSISVWSIHPLPFPTMTVHLCFLNNLTLHRVISKKHWRYWQRKLGILNSSCLKISVTIMVMIFLSFTMIRQSVCMTLTQRKVQIMSFRWKFIMMHRWCRFVTESIHTIWNLFQNLRLKKALRKQWNQTCHIKVWWRNISSRYKYIQGLEYPKQTYHIHACFSFNAFAERKSSGSFRMVLQWSIRNIWFKDIASGTGSQTSIPLLLETDDKSGWTECHSVL